MRGRPAGKMTHRRRLVLERYSEAANAGERINISRLSRECGLFDYRDARRILGDLKKMGQIADA